MDLLLRWKPAQDRKPPKRGLAAGTARILAPSAPLGAAVPRSPGRYTRLLMSPSALVLAGGSGTRFWPSSRRQRPKQFLSLEGERSLLQATVDRLRPLVPPERVWISTTEALASAVAEQLPEVPPAQILTEPAARNTAPAIGWSLHAMPQAAREGAVIVLPADHRIGDPEAFRAALALAAGVVLREPRILTLGVRSGAARDRFRLSRDGRGAAGRSRAASCPAVHREARSRHRRTLRVRRRASVERRHLRLPRRRPARRARTALAGARARVWRSWRGIPGGSASSTRACSRFRSTTR